MTSHDPFAANRLLSILDLEPLEINLFRSRSGSVGLERVFGGQVIAQALAAANRTVDPSRVAHSLHAYFLLAGDPKAPIVYDVDRIRDGRSFTTRRVVAIQHGRAIFSLAASYQKTEDGPEHQLSVAPDVPRPDEVPGDEVWRQRFEARLPPGLDREWMPMNLLEARPTSSLVTLADGTEMRLPAVWMRVRGQLPDDLPTHQAALAYASDFSLLQAALGVHGYAVYDPSLQVASLDHGLWFHRPFRADQWLLYAQRSPIARNARGFCSGELFTEDGVLVASAVQEGLIRFISEDRTAN